ncbi:MAG: Hpt domain-containing protein [Planctomycetes bacterium]|nr:Hpt domain-containing protein [Planctomycetota bacterium]
MRVNTPDTGTGGMPQISQLLLEDADLHDIVEEFVEGLQSRAAEIRAAYEQLDWELLRTLAHRLKGAGGSYGYPELSSLAALMEENFSVHRADEFGDWIQKLDELRAAAEAGLKVV